jgi:transcription elongation factor GreA
MAEVYARRYLAGTFAAPGPTGRAPPFVVPRRGRAPRAPRPSGRAMIEELKRKLGDEVEKLQHELNVVLPNEIRKAVELGDLRENSEYKAALERQQFVQARLGQLRQRLSKLSSVDMAQIPADKVGLGSRVVVEDERTGARETYNLLLADSAEFEDGSVSMGSPIGRALLGKGVGETAILKLPASVRRLKVIELQTIHQQA